MKFLPANTIAFSVWRTDTEAYNAAINTPNSGPALMQALLTPFSPDSIPAAVLQAFERSGFIASGTQPEIIKEGVLFLVPGESGLEFGGYITAVAPTNFRDKLLALETLLTKSSLEIAKQDFAGQSGFVVRSIHPANLQFMQELFIAADRETLALGSKKAIVDTLMSEMPDNQRFNETAKFESIKKTFSSCGYQIAVAYSDIEALKVLAQKQNLAKTTSNTIRFLPFHDLSFCRHFDTVVKDSIKVGLSALSPAQKDLLTGLDTAATKAFAALPKDVGAAVVTGKKLIPALRQLLTSSLSEDERKKHAERFANFDSTLSAAITAPETEHKLPDFIFNFESSNAKALSKQLQEEIALLFNVKNTWKERTSKTLKYNELVIVNLRVVSFTTPNQVVIATSERALRSALTALQKPANSLFGVLSTNLELEYPLLIWIDTRHLAPLIARPLNGIGRRLFGLKVTPEELLIDSIYVE